MTDIPFVPPWRQHIKGLLSDVVADYMNDENLSPDALIDDLKEVKSWATIIKTITLKQLQFTTNSYDCLFHVGQHTSTGWMTVNLEMKCSSFFLLSTMTDPNPYRVPGFYDDAPKQSPLERLILEQFKKLNWEMDDDINIEIAGSQVYEIGVMVHVGNQIRAQ